MVTEETASPGQPRLRITLPSGTVGRLTAWGAFLRRHRVGLCVAAMLVLQLWWRAGIVGQAFFKEDDFEFVARAAEHGLSWDYLTRVHYGQFMPVGFALAWVVSRAAPYDWGVAAGSVLVLFTLSGLAVHRMLRVVFGDRPAVLVPLAVYLFAPFTVPVLSWWSASLNLVPLLVAIPMAIADHVRHLRDGRPVHAVATTFWIVVALGSFLKAAALPFLLFGLTLAYFSQGAGVRGVLRRHAPLWATYGGVLVVYAAGYLAASRGVANLSGWPTLSQGLGFVRRLLFETFLSALLGGPWRWFPGPDRAVATPPAMLTGLAAVLAVALLIATAVYRRHGVRAWALLLGYLLLADVAPTYYGRVHILGAFQGLETRYVADAAPVLALVVGLVLLPLRGETRPYRRRPPREAAAGAGGLLLGGFVVGSLASSAAFAGYLGNAGVHDYLATAAGALRAAPPDAVVLDRPVPLTVVSPSYGPYARTSRLLAPLASDDQRRRMYAPPPYAKALVFDDQGHLREAEVTGNRVPAPGGCYPAANGVVDVPLPQAARPGDVVRLGYSASKDTGVRVYADGGITLVRLSEGLGRLLVPTRAGMAKVQIAGIAPDARVCFGDVAVGEAVPAP
ncbi:hypothetical protein [Sphaerisporangium fuscum]|uniref:hypothetical protein n=1 Tax=Sphaerisporangium fuscum TaxID=2835868 RepID=UPI001BDCF463|nr:hypothetical protein [Sphaerisporangium fuscum]